MSAEAIATLALLHTRGAGNVSVNEAIQAASQAGIPLADLLELDTREVIERIPPGFGGVAYTFSHCDAGCRKMAKQEITRMEMMGGYPLLISDADYPATLKERLGSAAPPMLSVMGNIDLLHTEMAGIVGARDAGTDTLLLARQCATTFAEHGVVIVSGGARGVDTAAHLATLKAGGQTVMVLPRGLLTYKGPVEIQDALEEGHATLISEFLPEVDWSVHAAVTRNATISALASFVCVLEPKKTGGSIRTAQWALKQGKDVLIHCRPSQADAERLLLRAGATLLPTENDALDSDKLLARWNERRIAVSAQTELFE